MLLSYTSGKPMLKNCKVIQKDSTKNLKLNGNNHLAYIDT